MSKKGKKYTIFSFIAVVLLVVVDQITKLLAVLFLKGKAPFEIIPGVFELKYLENQSAAFGMDPISLLHKIFSFDIFNKNPELFLQCKMAFFILFTIIILILFFIIFIKTPRCKRYSYIDYVLIFISAGAIGNFIDRISHQYVIDFLYFKLIDFPIFNVADIYVTCSAFVILFLGIFYYKDEDMDIIFPSKSKEEKK